MKPSEWPWNLHRFTVDRLGWQRPFGKRAGSKKLLLLSERDPICHTQYFPFWHHRQALGRRFRVEVREASMASFLAGRNAHRDADAVCFQTWFDLGPEAVRDLAVRLREAFPKARLAYFDWFAPTDLRYADALRDLVAVYAKKQVLRDRSRYGAVTLGDTNLTDYYARRFGLDDCPPTSFPIPDGFWDKLWISPHFAFSPHMLPRFLGAFPEGSRDIDLHARIAVKGTGWYTRMRQEALDHTLALEGRMQVQCRGRVGRDEYFAELYRSKLCFSPFGYGEVCWRDFEAMFTGSLLLKPDMGHLDCYPEAFFPGETYVSLAWDLSDFEEKVDFYRTHDKEREAIARRAFDLLAGYFRRQQFLADVEPLLARLGLLG